MSSTKYILPFVIGLLLEVTVAETVRSWPRVSTRRDELLDGEVDHIRNTSKRLCQISSKLRGSGQFTQTGDCRGQRCNPADHRDNILPACFDDRLRGRWLKLAAQDRRSRPGKGKTGVFAASGDYIPEVVCAGDQELHRVREVNNLSAKLSLDSLEVIFREDKRIGIDLRDGHRTGVIGDTRAGIDIRTRCQRWIWPLDRDGVVGAVVDGCVVGAGEEVVDVIEVAACDALHVDAEQDVAKLTVGSCLSTDRTGAGEKCRLAAGRPINGLLLGSLGERKLWALVSSLGYEKGLGLLVSLLRREEAIQVPFHDAVNKAALPGGAQLCG